MLYLVFLNINTKQFQKRTYTNDKYLDKKVLIFCLNVTYHVYC